MPHKRDVALDLRLIPCRAGGRSYYLDASAVRSVHRKEEWRLNWRSESPLGWLRQEGGEELPILDLARALGVSHTVVSNNAVVVDTGSGPKAWGVEGVGHVVNVSKDQLLPVPQPCVTKNSPPWVGVVSNDAGLGLCLAPHELGQPAPRPPAGESSSAVPAGQSTGRAILFHAFDGRGRRPEIRFCLGFGQVAELLTTPRLIPVPSGPPWVIGLIAWRGRSVPVIDLGWGVTGRTAACAGIEDYLIVRVNANGDLAAVTVFGRPEAVDLPFSCERENHPPLARPDWFPAVFKGQNQLFLTPAFASILATERA
jgi:chemotaxis signal transduction protein